MQTKLIGGGVYQPGVEVIADPNFQSLPVSLWPLDYTLGSSIAGLYRISFSLVPLALLANAIVANLRWATANTFNAPKLGNSDPLLFVLLRIVCRVSVSTAITAQRIDPIRAVMVRPYLTSEALGLTSVIISNADVGTKNWLRQTMGPSQVFQLAKASAGGGMGAGAGTEDSNPFGSMTLPNIAGLGSGLTGVLYSLQQGEHPMVFDQNEGLRIRWGGTSLATGAVVLSFDFEWAEVYTF